MTRPLFPLEALRARSKHPRLFDAAVFLVLFILFALGSAEGATP